MNPTPNCNRFEETQMPNKRSFGVKERRTQAEKANRLSNRSSTTDDARRSRSFEGKMKEKIEQSNRDEGEDCVARECRLKN